jgi:hypothetical protein
MKKNLRLNASQVRRRTENDGFLRENAPRLPSTDTVFQQFCMV